MAVMTRNSCKLFDSVLSSELQILSEHCLCLISDFVSLMSVLCRVVDTLKDYTMKAFINTVDHLGSITYKVNGRLDAGINKISGTELQVSCMEQVPNFLSSTKEVHNYFLCLAVVSYIKDIIDGNKTNNALDIRQIIIKAF